MIENTEHLRRLSDEFEINPEDILLIAINACGVANAEPSRRNRFECAPHGREHDPVYLIPSFGRRRSPFRIDRDQLLLHGEPVATIRNLKGDDIVMGYWRNGFRSLTLNSNARSACTGCTFCYTRLDAASDPKVSQAEELENYLSFVESDLSWEDLSAVERITVCSGCFLHEHNAIEHMALVSEIAAGHGFRGELHILSSVIRSRDGLKRIASELSPFHLTLTVECFDNRHEILKASKAGLEFGEMCRVLADAKEAGLKTDFTYLIGLDSIDRAVPKIEKLLDVTTTFPRFQIYQAHNVFQASYCTPGSNRLDFFLRFRKQLEAMFGSRAFRPQSWENYRPLWYYTFAGEPYTCTRI